MAPAPRTVPPRLVWLLCAVTSAASVALALLVWFVLLAPTEPELPRVPFESFVDDVHAGHVSEVRIDGTEYRFRVEEGGRGVEKRTTGPRADIARVRALRATGMGVSPRIFFER